MTDERIGNLCDAVARLPKGSGIVFRHHATPARRRRALFDEVRKIARRRRLLVILADTPARARAWGADGAHHRSLLQSDGIRTVAVHNGSDLRTAQRGNADLVFVSPVFRTRSHVDARPLGLARLGLLIGPLRHRTVALGGVNAARAGSLRALRIHGWAAIDGLSRD